MRYAVNYFWESVIRHKLAYCVALLVGVIYLAPYIFLIFSLGSHYQGVPAMQTPNEGSYLARIQDILDGHPALGSPFFFEYKNEWPLSPPVGEMFYAIPAFLLRWPAKDILLASKFILPLILFLLAYFLIYRLSEGDDFLARKINAIAGALFIVLGYDLVDYRHLWSVLSGQNDIGGFLLWARPVNPILGAIFLFSFLILVWKIIQQSGRRAVSIFSASVFLALMMGSYFFSWGMALSVLAMLILMYSIQGKFQTAKNLTYTLLAAILLASPYWYSSWQASKSSWYAESVLRSGLFLTHYPLLNKLMLAVLVAYVLAVLFSALKYSDKTAALRNRIFGSFRNWHLFCFAFIFGSLWAFSEQIITGRTIWPYHFVQYSIPLAIVVVMLILYNIVRKESLFFWKLSIGIIIVVSLSYGIYTQASAYRHGYAYNLHQQSYAPLFAWLNSQEKDCVVLIREDGPEGDALNVLIPALSHCNRYASTETFSLMPYERSLHNYLIELRLKGVPANGIEDYLRQNRGEATGCLYTNWQGLFNVKDFPDFSDKLLEERLARFPADYRQFMARDFKKELMRYRLDYILSVGPLPKNVIDQLSGPELVFTSNNLFGYSLIK
ncbi:MAG: hypothetical protein HZC14_00240 [Candidatus Niyogibacteria bacterium]|nr:hypothetical protein [Candidatus Niyogibacteria bacterium]